MKVITLKRVVPDTPNGTFGVFIFDDGYPYFVSVELPWRNNQTDISRIRAGESIWDRVISPKHGYEVYKMRDNDGRKDIEIHIANSINDLLGCIGIGMYFGITAKDGKLVNGVLDSKIALPKFMAMLRNDPQIKLVIVDC